MFIDARVPMAMVLELELELTSQAGSFTVITSALGSTCSEYNLMLATILSLCTSAGRT